MNESGHYRVIMTDISSKNLHISYKESTFTRRIMTARESMELSIIVPVYNVERHLKRCVKSIIAQGLADYEVILIDDGSTDGSAMLCDELARDHEGVIRVIHQVNGGLSAARNRGIEVAQGTYVTFVDSDDELCPETLGSNVRFLTDHPEVDMLEYPVEVHADSHEAHHLAFTDETKRCDVFSDWIRREGYRHCYAWNKVYRAHLWSNTRFPIGEYYEDTAVMPEIIEQCRVIHYSSHGCYRYIMHEGTITTSYRYDRQRQLYLNSRKLYAKIMNDEALHTEALRMWTYSLNLLIDMGRCADVNKVDYDHIITEADRLRPTMAELLKATPAITTRLKLIPLSVLGLKAYCHTYAALTKTLKA